MDSARLIRLLEKVREGSVDVSGAMATLRHLPFEDLGFAKVDHHRALRQGFPEVIMTGQASHRDRRYCACLAPRQSERIGDAGFR
jgi:NCAIR mutase (PurE)-related protein